MLEWKRLTSPLKLVDTNVFIYGAGRPHQYKESCAKLSAELIRGEHDANIDTELLQEVLFLFWRRERIDEGLRMLDRIVTGFPDPFAVTLIDVRAAREILSRHRKVSPRNAIHAAVVLTHGLEGIISTDRGFNGIPGVTRFDPMEF